MVQVVRLHRLPCPAELGSRVTFREGKTWNGLCAVWIGQACAGPLLMNGPFLVDWWARPRGNFQWRMLSVPHYAFARGSHVEHPSRLKAENPKTCKIWFCRDESTRNVSLSLLVTPHCRDSTKCFQGLLVNFLASGLFESLKPILLLCFQRLLKTLSDGCGFEHLDFWEVPSESCCFFAFWGLGGWRSGWTLRTLHQSYLSILFLWAGSFCCFVPIDLSCFSWRFCSCLS